MARIALWQATSGIDPDANAQDLTERAAQAADDGAAMLFTPEMTGMLDRDRKRAASSIRSEDDDPTLASARETAARHGLWIALGSVALDTGEGRWVNRSFVLDPAGEIGARYDKLHMFDVDLADGESWRESNAYRPGDTVVTVPQTPIGRLGLAICYDIRFPALFDALGSARCDVIAIPAAFTVPTGKAHWHILQQARAIEASAYVVAAAQVGEHADGRRTYGHSLVIDPWGEVLLDMGGEEPGLGFAEIDPARIDHVRAQVPSLANRRDLSTAARP
ncbi:carbon-nitrogen hydrolase family protein [Erythrobacter sp. 3-20A1M]|uniref:carbon-nitrogen hydrolase family protein n=1 Tax=Erythrobacter sp. 3-20A1M TaxID=2653850 RepID=UPI001BFC7256|nr:carbon-nitrogen hydrolase family protein [Erythrobacter sp. 3-20A1M]QWC58104.1 carbon-nitrogen hydrolase family protein [Erythrobacter sp. 3-20A1M]